MKIRQTFLPFILCIVVSVPCILTISRTLGKPAASGRDQNSSKVTPPVVIDSRQPDSNPTNKEFRFQRTCVLEVEIDEKGNVDKAKVVQPVGGGLDEKALATIKTWKFKPGMADGTPTRFRTRVEIKFQLRDDPGPPPPCPEPFVVAR